MGRLLHKILSVYKQELKAYEMVFEITAREKRVILENRPLTELIDLLKEKRQLVRRIESLDGSIRAEKGQLKEKKGSMNDEEIHMLNEMIGALKQIIEKILSLERESEEMIIAQSCFSLETNEVSGRSERWSR